jgi:hypothetical protein
MLPQAENRKKVGIEREPPQQCWSFRSTKEELWGAGLRMKKGCLLAAARPQRTGCTLNCSGIVEKKTREWNQLL